MANFESAQQNESSRSAPQEIPTLGDQVRVNTTTDFYSNIAIKGPEGRTEEVQVYRSKDGEFQAIIKEGGKKIVGSSSSQPADAVERALHILNPIRMRENKDDVWGVDYSK